MTPAPEPPAFPGGTGVSGLSVYDWPAADGLCGGSPHVHLVCTEAYVVVAGAGRLQTLTAAGTAETPLRPGTVVWFGPGTVHRAVNDGGLRAVVVMQNSGLPEAGDAVFTFPSGVLADPEAYAAAARAGDAREARRRRDLAVAGFRALAGRTGDGVAAGADGGGTDGGGGHGAAALEEFHRQALALRAGRLTEWEEVWRAGARQAADRTAAQLAALRAGDTGHLRTAAVAVREPPGTPRWGMCGRLDTYDLTPGGATGG
ncbi:cupin domain-containing protein [Streptomyces sp. JJ36]|nr:cupin domain-containing protein [Streptomyces sp. JJ36]